ncbi:MAG: metallophosphoesterase [Symbiobacteriaceae bacterium]|jgi:putative phosphoesterase|nr:metallophosphoesterase [Symbiobacteriaceae bacterium]
MTTRIALVTDIHGNAPALRAALSAIDAAPEIHHIACLGDAVSIGPDVNEVLDLLRARPNLFMVKGNHETYVLACRRGEPLPKEVGAGEAVHQRWMADRITSAHAAWLETLPFQVEAEYEGVRIRFLHYHGEQSGRFAPWWPDLAKMEEHYGGAPADVVCFGHIHKTLVEQGAERLYVDPGSAGCFDRPAARFAILTLDAGHAQVELCEAPYDNQAFLASYDALEVPDREFIRRIFHGNQAW